MTTQAPGIAFPAPYLIYLGDVEAQDNAKTGFGMAEWAAERCIGQWRQHPKVVSVGLPELDAEAAAAAGARSLVIGIAAVGGEINPAWHDDLRRAAAAGLTLVNGGHDKLASVTGLADAAAKTGAALIDIRDASARYPVATGVKRSGKRLLTVGTDCALGKKYTALAIVREMQAHGMDASFCATGQTGIMIAGRGIAIDSIVSDFVAGAAEALTPNATSSHWDVVEGQGSLYHPGYAAVTLGLLHGSQPDEIVLCHDPRRSHNLDSPQVAIPPLPEVIDLYLRCGALTNPGIRCRAISLNTRGMGEQERQDALAQAERDTGLLVFDPIATGTGPLVEALSAL